MTVTAQDFWDTIDCTETLSHRTGLTDLEEVPKESTLKSFDALLSRARQEERHEYAKEVRAFMNDALEVAKESEIKRAKQEARREALKEMDEAWGKGIIISVDPVVTRLRKEYSNQP
jgi:hypothetical protein